MRRIIKIWNRPQKNGFYAINLFGFIFTCRELTQEEINHERIHTAQAKELLFLPFYIWYVLEWIWLLLKFKNAMKAYYGIRFEKEAYRHQYDLNYLDRRKHYHYK